MKNFPSSLIRQQNTKNGLGSTMSDTLKNIGSQFASNLFTNGKSSLYKTNMTQKFETGYTRPELPQMLEETNIFVKNSETLKIENNINQNVDLFYNLQNGKDKDSNIENVLKIQFEDPFRFSSSIFSTINNYKYIFNYTVPGIVDLGGKIGDKTHMVLSNTIVSPSLFNPYVGINVTGITENIPLINKYPLKPNVDEMNLENSYSKDNKDAKGKLIKNGLSDKDKHLQEELTFNTQLFNGVYEQPDISDCSIRTLVKLSNEGKLGSENYRYQDFMYCKDLGKIPNNRLITLRRFASPIGDNIYDDNICGQQDIGRLITWFDNDDNKLENICKYSYRASWEKFTAEIDIRDSEDQDKGLTGKLAHFLSPKNNDLVAQGYSQKTGIFSTLTTKLHLPEIATDKINEQYYTTETLKNYDKHKLYEPQNRIKEIYKYDGNLEFNQDITLTFRYVLRSYDNINPRAAMMDLLGNIMVVTYTRGKFWGGENKIVGGTGNKSVYEKSDALIENAFKKMGGIWDLLCSGEYDIESIKGWISNMINKAGEHLEKAKNDAKKTLGDGTLTEQGKNLTQAGAKELKKLNDEYHWTNAMKGMIKNQLGRPAIYAFNSLLTGEPNGLWHLTIGNPRNPIMSIGNLIIDSPAEIQHYGPLGLDDFPTEMSVTVTLKPQRARDKIDIEKMYTKGRSGIYQPMNLIDVNKYFSSEAFGDLININSKGLRINLSNIN